MLIKKDKFNTPLLKSKLLQNLFTKVVDKSCRLLYLTPMFKESEYRTPSIDEFVDGYTYEVYSEGYEGSVEDFCGWYTYTIGINCWRDIDDIKRELERGYIRVVNK